MEESEKINGKKKLPAIPSNYVSLVQLQERWIKEREQKKKEGNQGPEQEEQQGEKEKQVEERVNNEVDGRGGRKSEHFRRHDRERGKRVAEWKPKDDDKVAAFAVNEGDGVEKEQRGEKSKNKKKWKNKRKNKKEEKKAEAENEGEEVLGTAANAPLPASVECDKGEKEEGIADEVLASEQASAEKENVEARTEDRTVEIGRKPGGMSMNGEIRSGGYRKYGRQSSGFNHRGGNMELNASNYGKSGRRREPNRRNEAVWVKKGEGSDGHVGGIQCSSCSAKELD